MAEERKSSPRNDDFGQREYPIPERIESQRLVWKLERAAFIGLLLIALAALTGVFSDGALSSAQVATPSQRIRVDYERFERSGATSRLHIRLRGTPGQPAVLRLGGDLLARHDVQSLQPALSRTESWHAGAELQGRLDEHGELHLYLALLPNEPGLLQHTVEYAGESLIFRQFVYP